MKIYILIFLIFCLTLVSIAQDENLSNIDNKLNSIYVEAFGNGLFYSLNYERIFYDTLNSASSICVGYSFFPVNTDPDFYVQEIPIMVNYITPKDKPVTFELGIGSRIMYAFEKGKSDSKDWAITLDIYGNVGARFIIHKHLLYKINWTPQFSTSWFGASFYDKNSLIWFGSSLGYSF